MRGIKETAISRAVLKHSKNLVTYEQLFVWEVVAVSVPDRLGSTIAIRRLNRDVAERESGEVVLTVEQVVGVPIVAIKVGHRRGLCWPLQLQRDATAVR